MTFEFEECKHRFCVECMREMLKAHIDCRELDELKCGEFECGKPVSEQQLETLFSETHPEVLEKYRRFKSNATEESNPLMRFCTKPGCEGKIIADDENATKIVCQICEQEVCFMCRESWHEGVSCEDAGDKELR
jgi:hypothetical protein